MPGDEPGKHGGYTVREDLDRLAEFRGGEPKAASQLAGCGSFRALAACFHESLAFLTVARPMGSFGDEQRHRRGGSLELVGDSPMASNAGCDLVGQLGHLHGEAIDLEAMVRETSWGGCGHGVLQWGCLDGERGRRVHPVAKRKRGVRVVIQAVRGPQVLRHQGWRCVGVRGWGPASRVWRLAFGVLGRTRARLCHHALSPRVATPNPSRQTLLAHASRARLPRTPTQSQLQQAGHYR